MNLKDIDTDDGESVQDALDRVLGPEEVRREVAVLLVEVHWSRRMVRMGRCR